MDHGLPVLTTPRGFGGATGLATWRGRTADHGGSRARVSAGPDEPPVVW
ncbi:MULTISPECIES: hypothetical protein [Streptomycetaceae]|uniref:Uncharacterized protein n=1 Tax=Streptantibioticus cattleyicolor (strain ATCC 35852 / DSM 46488 / JCM 4925 / NBRC 14057 / NRRL 8057) TaxID=1003195 RepID=G8X1M9_STREN|nr:MULTISPECIES: hypothetical protein [Streptomycetaceae]AEW92558.1 hypothetical protein SCATT_01870 [Streptantibioticus cattleyicolor NRRL 8057 = DSM 46488]MYS57345.1 hypothetical protein [Streptomyces sp. SID5468]